MIMLVRTMNFSSASQVLSLIGPERHTARLLPDGTRADLAAVSPVAHSLTSVPLFQPDRTSGSRRLVPIGAAVTAHPRSHRRPAPDRALVVRSDRHRADRPLDPTADIRRCLCSDTTPDERRPHRGCIHTCIADTSGMPWPSRHHLTVNVTAMPTLHLERCRDINEHKKGTKVLTMAQRQSEPQLIANDLDEVIPEIIHLFGADGLFDERELNAIRRLRLVSNRTSHHAEVHDWAHSVEDIGMTPRNRRKMVDLFPDLGPSAA